MFTGFMALAWEKSKSRFSAAGESLCLCHTMAEEMPWGD